MSAGKPIIPGCTALIVGSGLPHDGKLVHVEDFAWTGMVFKSREGTKTRIIVYPGSEGKVFVIHRLDGGPIYSPYRPRLTFDSGAISKVHLIRLDDDQQPEADDTDADLPIVQDFEHA